MNTDINIYAAVIHHFHVFGVFLLGRTMIFASHLGLSLFSCHFVAWAWLVISFEQSPGRLFEYCRMPINIAYSCKWNCAVQSVLFHFFFQMSNNISFRPRFSPESLTDAKWNAWSIPRLWGNSTKYVLEDESDVKIRGNDMKALAKWLLYRGTKHNLKKKKNTVEPQRR